MNTLHAAKRSSLPCFEKLLNQISQSAFILNKEGEFRFANRHCHKLLAYSASQLHGRLVSEIVCGKDRQKVERLINRKKDIPVTPTEFIKRNGLPIVIEWSAKWDIDAGVWYCTAHLKQDDNSKAQQIQGQYEKKIKEHNRRLAALLERIGEGFVALDEEDRVIYWNRKAEFILGKSREEVLTRKIWECYPEMATSEFCSFYKKAIEQQTHQEYEAYYHEEKKWIKIVFHPGNSGVTAFFRDITEVKKIEEQLELQKKQTRKKISSAVIQAQEKERTQISQELHDNVNQVLTTVKLYTELCANDLGNKELMHKSVSFLQYCINEIRSVSKQLSAPTLGKISLKDSLKELVKTITDASRAKIKLNTKDVDDIEVGKDLHLAIYRIVQEHLTNIIKHANAKTVRIVTTYVDDDIVLKVVDDGKGFKVDEATGGIGIANMTSRAESLGGRLSINSAPGLGCVLIAHFPASL